MHEALVVSSGSCYSGKVKGVRDRLRVARTDLSVKETRLLMKTGIDILCQQATGMDQAATEAPDQHAREETPHQVQIWLQVGILGVMIGFLYFEILGKLVMDWWTDPNFSHGFLVPAFSAFVIWHKRKELSKLEVRPSWFGLLVVAGSLVVLIVGALGAELFLQRCSLVLLLGGLIVYFLGWHHFRALLFPLAFLFFMIPIPAIIFNQIAFPLQFVAARLADSLLALFGVPVLREGNVIQLPTITLEVAEACSGIRSLMSLGALAVIYGYFLEPRNLRRVLLALAAIPIAVVANGLRVMGTGLAGYFWDPAKAEGFFHEFSGWVIFITSLALLIALHGVLRWLWRLRRGTKNS